MIVLDSWAVLRFLEDAPPAAELVAEAVASDEDVAMSWINLSEVHYVLRRLHGEEAALETVRDIQSDVDARLPSKEDVLAAARIKADHPMSFADAFAAATAAALDAELWTGDRELLVDQSAWRWRDVRERPGSGDTA